MFKIKKIIGPLRIFKGVLGVSRNLIYLTFIGIAYSIWSIMALPVMEFQDQRYKIRKIFA